ncbi:phosphate acetyltransferase [Mycoplasma sp. T363T]|uniref:phosphate acetyltransferase n=1 Tax=Mycoplasma bradburyae TaxID=2963128 RepID=UPI0023418A9E|nr:phosphate acetyltransferase [Mycoplasma bradburyae]MDC4162974.1 phosphate acetyltransferase [Mycoplasma bradburyae]
MSILIEELKNKIKESKKTPEILLVEGWHPYVQEAAKKLVAEKLVKPVLIFRTIDEIPADFDPRIRRYVIEKMDLSKYATYLFKLREKKGMTLEVAQEEVKKPNVLAALLVKLEEVDGEVCGKEYTTKDTLKPALQIIKTAEGEKIVGSVMVLEKGEERLVFTDCAINLYPTSEELAEIAKSTIKFSKQVLQTEKINLAMLSYSTLNSGAGESVDKIKEATKLLEESEIGKLASICGPMQFDAAYVEEVRKQKAPKLDWEKGANTFVFPNIDAGNIGYKIAQRLGGYEAIGPILTGLAKPVNDLSRGASANEIYSVAIITASQAVANK